MILELIVEGNDDPRFRINVLEAIDNPLDPNGDGYPIDIFAEMARAISKIPTREVSIAEFEALNRTVESSCRLVFKADKEAVDIMINQAISRAILVEPSPANVLAFRNIPIEQVGADS